MSSKKNKLNKILIILSIIFLVISLLALTGCSGTKKVDEVKEENLEKSYSYYKRNERIISLEIDKLSLKEKVNLLKNKSRVYYNSLSDDDKTAYSLVEQTITDYLYDTLTTENSKNYFKIPFTNTLSKDVFKKLLDYFFLDNPGMFFIDNSFIINVTSGGYEVLFETLPTVTDKTSLESAINLFLVNTGLLYEVANAQPFTNEKVKKLFEFLTEKYEKTFKNTKTTTDLSDYSVSLFMKDKYLNKLNFNKIITYVLDKCDIEATFYPGNKESNPYNFAVAKLQNKLFLIDSIGYAKKPDLKYRYRYLLTKKDNSFTPTYAIFDNISSLDFNDAFKHKNGQVYLQDKTNIYKNRINLNEPVKNLVSDNKFSDAQYNLNQVPITNLSLTSKKDFSWDYNYIYSDNTLSKTLPSTEGAYKLHINSKQDDAYFEVKISFKVVPLFDVTFKTAPGINDETFKVDLEVFKGDYTKKPLDPKIDGWVFNSYENPDKYANPITESTIITASFTQPSFKFYDEDGKENNSISVDVSKGTDSDSILKNVIPDIAEGYMFIGYKNKKTNKFIGKSLKGEIIAPDKENPTVELIAIVKKVKLTIKGTAFRHNKKVRNAINTFKVHPKNRVPDLVKVKFGKHISTVGLKFYEPFENIKTNKQYKIRFTARSIHSFYEKDVEATIIVDDNMFFTKGWLKAKWWLVILIIVLIVFSPFILKFSLRLIKFIIKKRKQKRKENELKENEEQVDKYLAKEKRIKRKEKYLEELRNQNKQAESKHREDSLHDNPATEEAFVGEDNNEETFVNEDNNEEIERDLNEDDLDEIV